MDKTRTRSMLNTQKVITAKCSRKETSRTIKNKMAQHSIKTLRTEERDGKKSKRKHCGKIEDIHDFWPTQDKDEVKKYGAQQFEYLQRIGGMIHKHGSGINHRSTYKKLL
jgi:hypothetical protein